MKNLYETVRAMYAPKTEATMMQDDGKMVHNCAKHVEHAEYGTGNCIAEEHADPDRYGNIAWYDIEFPHGVERGVPISELKVLQAESHGHAAKAKKKKMAEEAESVDEVMNVFHRTSPGADMKRYAKDSPAPEAAAHRNATAAAAKDLRATGALKRKSLQYGSTDDIKTPKGGTVMAMKREEVEQVDETVLHKDVEFEVTIAEKDYKSYFKAAMKGKDLGSMSADEKKKHFNKVDAGYKAKNEDVFLEAMFDSHINDIIAAHKKSGNRVSDEKSAMSDGKMKHSYVITTPEGKRTRHIHHGSTKKLETMSPAKKSKQSQEQDLDDKD